MTAYLKVVPIVEGHGDVAAVPILLRRCAQAFFPCVTVDVLKPIRQPRDRLVMNKDDCLVKATQLAAAKLKQHHVPAATSWIIVLVDADEQCAASLGPRMQSIAGPSALSIPVSLVLAVKEFETWLVGGANTLRDQLDVAEADIPAHPEDSGTKKAWIQQRITAPKYSETVDQPRLTAAFDLVRCRQTCPSFDKLCREFAAQLREN